MTFTRIASSWARLRNLLAGHVEGVDTIGILTAWNPKGQAASKAFNQAANKKLLADLKDLDLGPIKIKGRFMGNMEESFLVRNITREQIYKFCRKYKQEAVIHGVRLGDSDRFTFSMLSGSGENLDRPQTLVLGKEEIQDRTDMYSFLGGEEPRPPKRPGQIPPTRKKFLIPFFDPQYGE